MTRPWTVCPHAPIERFEDNLWSVAGDVPGMALRRRMTVIRLRDGRLVIHSCMPLRDAEQRELEAWGEPAFIVVPNGFHRMDAPAYKARYPQAKVLCAPEAAARVGQVCAVDGTFADLPSGDAVSCQPIRGTRGGEHAFLVDSGGRTSLVFNDVVFNHPHAAGFAGFMMRAIGSTGGPRVTRFARLMLVNDRAALRAHLEQLANTPRLARILVSHVDPIVERPADVLRDVARAL